MEKNEFYCHNKTGNTRVTVCGVYNEGTAGGNKLVLSAVSMPQQSFRRAMARDIARLRTSIRPMLEITCANFEEAREQFKVLGPTLNLAVVAYPLHIFRFPNVTRASAVKDSLEKKTSKKDRKAALHIEENPDMAEPIVRVLEPISSPKMQEA